MEESQFLAAISYSVNYPWDGSGSLLVEGTNKGNISSPIYPSSYSAGENNRNIFI